MKIRILFYFLVNLSCQSQLSTFFFWGGRGFGLSRLTSLQLIQYHVAGFISQPFLKVHPPICGITAHATMPGESFSTIFVPSFDPNEWCLKNGLHSRGLNPGPIGHESSALPTRPRQKSFIVEINFE